MEKEDADQHRAYSTDARPNGIGRADGQRLDGFCEQHSAEHVKDGEARQPFPVGQSYQTLGFAETECETHFAQPSDDENNPVHSDHQL